MNRVISKNEQIAFTCTRCGKCCSSGPNVALTVQDVCRISKYLGVHWRELAGKYIYVVLADQIPVLLLRGINDRCVFMLRTSNVASCGIYPARPIRCRLYPFIPIAPGSKDEMEISSNCPGVGKGEVGEPPWEELERFIDEIKRHYSRLYRYIFEEGYTPLQALEKTLNDECT